ncbi:class I SAM-dependent methyltransferase [bacterium]|nr:class I SAM-dependent methyltransferase [bacterium]
MITIDDYYSQYADLYDNNDESSFFIFKEEIAKFSNALTPKSLILDAGCGPGKESAYFTEQGHKVIGLDISEGMLQLFREKIPNARTIQGDFNKIPLDDESVDAVFCSFALLHLNNKDGYLALTEFTRVLKKNGALFLGTTIQEGNEEYYTHKTARKLNLPGIYFHHWDCDELLKTIKQLNYSIENKTLSKPIENRPGVIVLLGKKVEPSL